MATEVALGVGNRQAALRKLEQCWRVAAESRGREDRLTRRAGEALASLYHRVGRSGEAKGIEATLAQAAPEDS